MTANNPDIRVRAVKILARSIYKDLVAQGFNDKQIVSLATELISEVTTSISAKEPQAANANANAR